MRRWVVLGIACAALVIGCKRENVTAAPGQTLTVRGQLEAGVECPMIVTSDGRRYAVGGDLGRFKVGDRVCIRGTVAEVSFCMAGEATLAIVSIGAESECP